MSLEAGDLEQIDALFTKIGDRITSEVNLRLEHLSEEVKRVADISHDVQQVTLEQVALKGRVDAMEKQCEERCERRKESRMTATGVVGLISIIVITLGVIIGATAYVVTGINKPPVEVQKVEGK